MSFIPFRPYWKRFRKAHKITNTKIAQIVRYVNGRRDVTEMSLLFAEESAKMIKEGLKNTGGYCPCRIERNEDTIVPHKAPITIIPSKPKFTIPLLSENTPPIATIAKIVA